MMPWEWRVQAEELSDAREALGRLARHLAERIHVTHGHEGSFLVCRWENCREARRVLDKYS